MRTLEPQPARPAAPRAALTRPTRPHRAELRLERHSHIGHRQRHEPAKPDPKGATGKQDESGEPFHVQQANQIRATREAWREAGHSRTPRVSVSRSIFALVTDADRAYFGGRSGATESADPVRTIDTLRAIFGRTYAAAPERLVEQRRADEAIAEADTLLLTVPNQLGVAYCAHAIEAVLKEVAPALGWR